MVGRLAPGPPAPRAEFCRGAGAFPLGARGGGCGGAGGGSGGAAQGSCGGVSVLRRGAAGGDVRGLLPGPDVSRAGQRLGHSPQRHVWGCWRLSVRAWEGSGGRLPGEVLEAWVRLFFPGLEGLVWAEPGLCDADVARAYVFLDRSRTPVDLVGDTVGRLVRLRAAREGGAAG